MIDNYYKILKVSRNAGSFKIAYRYRRICRRLIKSLPLNEIDKAYYEDINCAFEVLRNDSVRKYYDILYSVKFLNKSSANINHVLEKYVSIINNYSSKGKVKAERILKEEHFYLTIAVKEPLIISYLRASFMLYTQYPKFMATPLAGLLEIIGGIILIILSLTNSSFIVIGILLFLSGIINSIINFRLYTVDLMNDATEDQYLDVF